MNKLLVILGLLLVSFSAQAVPAIAVVHTQYSCTGTAGLALAKNSYRKSLLIQNRGAAAVRLTVNAAPSSSEGIEVIAGGNWEPYFVPQGGIYCKSSSGTNSLEIIVGN